MNSNFLSIIGILASVLGIVISLYLYEKSKKERIPTFIVSDQRLILEPKEIKEISSSNISIVDENYQKIKNNIYSTDIYFWNRGNQSIKPKDILTNPQIVFENSVIRDIQVLKIDREFCDIELKPGGDKSIINLGFKILEKDDGFSARILYESDKEITPIMEGEFEAVNSISSFPLNNYQLLNKVIFNLLIGTGMVILMLFLIGIESMMTSRHRRVPEERNLYTDNLEYKKLVDSLRNIQSKMSKIEAGKEPNDSQTTKLKKQKIDQQSHLKKKKTWKAYLYSGIFIFLFSIIYFTWNRTKLEVIKNPINYVPENILNK